MACACKSTARNHIWQRVCWKQHPHPTYAMCCLAQGKQCICRDQSGAIRLSTGHLEQASDSGQLFKLRRRLSLEYVSQNFRILFGILAVTLRPNDHRIPKFNLGYSGHYLGYEFGILASLCGRLTIRIPKSAYPKSYPKSFAYPKFVSQNVSQIGVRIPNPYPKFDAYPKFVSHIDGKTYPKPSKHEDFSTSADERPRIPNYEDVFFQWCGVSQISKMYPKMQKRIPKCQNVSQNAKTYPKSAAYPKTYPKLDFDTPTYPKMYPKMA